MKIDENISVRLDYDSKNKKVAPRWVSWQNRLHAITKIGLHHTFRKGHTLFHVFSVTTKTIFFRLVLDTSNLHWTVEEIADNA